MELRTLTNVLKHSIKQFLSRFHTIDNSSKI